jgi:hypothetical protein
MYWLGQPKWLWWTSIALCVCGALLIASSYRTAQQARRLPRMTCAELLRRGPAAPQFVTLTDVHLGQAGQALRRDMDAALEMYVPIYSAHLKQQPAGADFRLLLEVLDDRQLNRLLARAEVGALTVELWSDASQLDPWVDRELATRYPGIQVRRCRVVSVGLHEPSLVRSGREWRDGFVLVLLAMALQAGWLAWRRFKHEAPTAPAAAIPPLHVG